MLFSNRVLSGIAIAGTSLCLAATAAIGRDILRLEPENAVWVVGFSRNHPATMDDVAEADRTHGWNLVSVDTATDTYILDASLWIGGTSLWTPTYMQIGRPGHTNETLVVHGDVWIRAPRRSLERPDGRSGLINRLTLGTPDNPGIRAQLKIHCKTLRQYGLWIGERTERGVLRGGDLFAFNSVLTAAVQDGQHNLRGTDWYRGFHTGWYGSRVELVNSEISHIDGQVTYYMQAEDYRIRGCRFHHSGTLVRGGTQRMLDCRFTDMSATPITGRRIECIRCVFRNNPRHWQLRSSWSSVAEMINCDMGPSDNPILLAKNSKDPKWLYRTGTPLYPFYIERASCVVKVLDEAGNPVQGAAVSVLCSDDPYRGRAHLEAVRNAMVFTDEKGVTPARCEDGAILPAVKRLQATDDPAAPRQDTLTYTLRVEAKGYRPVQTPLPVTNIGTMQTVTLKTGTTVSR